METIKWAVNEMPKTDDSQLQVMSLENVAKARAFHESFPQYSVTPLVKLGSHGYIPWTERGLCKR